MDFIIVLQHDLCAFRFGRKEGFSSELQFLDDGYVQDEMRSQEEEGLSLEELDELERKREEEDKAGKAEEDKGKDRWKADLGLNEDSKVVWDEQYACAFERLFEEFVNSKKHILVCEFSFPLAQMISMCVDYMEKNHPVCHFYCVAFSHNDADTILLNHPRPPENSLGWRDWYKEGIARLFPVFQFVDIPYLFALNDDYLWGLVDKERPHLPDSRERRKWLGNALRRYERGLAAGTEETAEWVAKKKAEVQEQEHTHVN
jgi:hypothetical protein